MDLTRAQLLHAALADQEFAQATDEFGHGLRRATTRNDGLLLFGPRNAEPWHLAAHIDDELHFAGVDDLRSALIRWQPEADAPPHLRLGLERLADASRGSSLVVVTEDQLAPDALERIADVRRRGAAIFGIAGRTDADLADLCHELLLPGSLAIPQFVVAGQPGDLAKPTDGDFNFELAQHFVSIAVGSIGPERPAAHARSGWRKRMRKVIERLT